MDKKDWNTTIICMDDEEGIIELYKNIFLNNIHQANSSPRKINRVTINPDEKNNIYKFNLLTATSGEQAVKLVKEEKSKGNRIAAGFFDIKMPGGMDGLETIKEIKKIDPDIMCAIVTAYMDRSIQQIGSIFSFEEQWVFLSKPFSIFEIEQLAKNLIYSWNLNQQNRMFNQKMEEKIQEKTSELQNKLHQLNLIHEITSKINSLMSLDKIIELMVNETTALFQSEIGSLMLIDEKTNELEVKAASGPKSIQVINKRRKIDDKSISGYVFLNNKSLLIADISQDGRFGSALSEQQRFDCDNFLCTPIITKEKTIGVIVLGKKAENGVFTEHELNFLETLARQVGFIIENAKLYDSLQLLYINTLTAFSAALEAKDAYTKGHSDRVAEYSLLLGKSLGLSEAQLNSLRQVAVLHDIGKIGIPEEIINKPGKLLEAEFEIVKKHSVKSEEIISKVSFLSEVVKSLRAHHERFDGKGYPDGLSGENIPLYSRIIALADTFDAMISDRPYRKGLSKNIALEEIRRCAGTQFDFNMAKVFVQMMENYQEHQN